MILLFYPNHSFMLRERELEKWVWAEPLCEGRSFDFFTCIISIVIVAEKEHTF